MSIAKNAYMKRMTEMNRERLAETALSLAEYFAESNRAQTEAMGRDLCNEFYRVLTQVKGWKPYEARFATQQLAQSLQAVRS